MKNNIKFLAVLALLSVGFANAQVGIGTITPNASAALDVTSTNRGLLLPRLTTTNRNAIASPATGLMIYNTSTNQVEANTGIPTSPVWTTAGGVQSYGEIRGTVQTITANYTIQATDHVIITNHSALVIISLPDLTVSDTGKLIYILNDNTTATAITINALGTPLPAGSALNQTRGRIYMWTGARWLTVSPS